MAQINDKKALAMAFLLVSLLFFAMGLMFPLMQTGYGIGPITLRSEKIYLFTSFRYFFEQGEIFIGGLLLFFTIMFPTLKYIFLFLILTGKKFPKHGRINTILEIINKWAMLDVFVVAVLILNMKFDSDIIITRLEAGTTLFGVSVLLMMICSFLTRRLIDT